MKENRQGCLSRSIRAGTTKSAKRVALPASRPTKKTPTQQLSRTKPQKYKSPPLRKGEGCVKGGPSAGSPFALSWAAIFRSVQGYALPVSRPTKKTPTQQLSRTKPPKYKSPPLRKGEGCVKGEPLRFPLRVRSGQRFLSLCRGCVPPSRPTKKTPEGVFFVGTSADNGFHKTMN